jgi:protein-tyrosine phosphatase
MEVLDWLGANDRRTVAQRAVESLLRGQVVALPTETLYGVAASALVPEAVERLSQIRGVDEPVAVAMVSPEDASSWVPQISSLGRRLARRCWPGPVTLVFAGGAERGRAGQLPESIRRQLCSDDAIGLTVSEHDVLGELLRLTDIPIAFAHLACNGMPPTAERVAQQLGERVALLVDGGPSRDIRASSVVRVDGQRWTMVREGVVPANEIAVQTTCVVVFVCTGNTCRSPMAQALGGKLLADRLGCAVAELPQRGFLVLSAGVAALPGDPAAPEAIEAVKEFGADLNDHLSQPLTAELALQADHLITMTRAHAAAVVDRFGAAAAKPRLLGLDGDDIADPIGREQQVYRDCARQILQHLERLVPELQSS